MPAQADFIEQLDNYAKWDLRDIDFVEDDWDILHALKMAVVAIYHARLKERQRLKKSYEINQPWEVSVNGTTIPQGSPRPL